jgi:hemolysin III
MDFLSFREPFSAWSHCSWMLLSLLGTVYLWRRSGGDLGKKISLLVFGLSLAFCYACSTLNHGVRLSADKIAVYNLLDYIGIYVAMAGSYTPLAWNLLRGRWRVTTLSAAWLMAAGGTAVEVAWHPLPPLLFTGLYLAMGWGGILCYFEIARRLTHRLLRPALLGGLLYSVGAVMNFAEWPIFWPGVIGYHDVVHVFEMAGSLFHFGFMVSVVVPFEPSSVRSRPAPRPRMVPAAFGKALAPGQASS